MGSQAVGALGAFDPEQPGTPESLWRATLDRVATWAPRTPRLLVVSPHPDDEVLGAGGLMRAWACAKGSVTLVSVTNGEAAYPHWRELAQVRRSELKQAIERLCGTRVTCMSLSIPDGRVSQHTGALRAALRPLISDDTTLIAPFESDGHPDHDATGAVCCELASAKRIAIARYPVWAWHRLSPATLPVRWGRFPLQPVACQAKAAAVACFASQIIPHDGAAIIPAHVLSHFSRPYEAFVL